MKKEKYIDLYKKMVLIRLFEEEIANIIINNPGEINTPCHLYTGQEAVAVGICNNLTNKDYIFGNHRSHGYYISMGGNINKLMAEIYGKKDGCSKGRGGSMHIASVDKGMIGSTAIVAGTVSIALGAALSSYISNKRNVSVTFFGDGAVNEGVIYESINFAVLRKLPIIFVCENNLYATHVPINKHIANTNISQLVKGFNIKSIRIDGNDVIKINKETQTLIKQVRNGKGPIFIECLTYRQRGHVGGNYDINKGLRAKKELQEWIKKCPIKKLKKYIINNNISKEEEINKIDIKIENEIKKAITYAHNSQYIDKNDLKNLVFNNIN